MLLQLAWVLVASASTSATTAEPASIKPSLEQAKRNATPIFNSIHSAMRQWGSSLNHNGLAAIPATIPKGKLLYHGTHSSDANTTGLEWLAFEPEHSEAFVPSWRARRTNPVQQQTVLQPASPPAIRGYLRTYQATRDLHLLYLDGMSAGKGCLGTVDTQDLVLRLANSTTPPPCDTRLADVMAHDVARVRELCAWAGGGGGGGGYDGLLRMETGFEVVYCDFGDGGLALRSALRRPFWDQMAPAWYGVPRLVWHLVRAAALHYDGMAEAGRVRLDLSRMVSAYFYPVDVAGSGAGRSRVLPRLVNTTRAERQAIRRRVREVAGLGGGGGVGWQAVVDAVVARYAGRLAVLARPLRADGLGGR